MGCSNSLFKVAPTPNVSVSLVSLSQWKAKATKKQRKKVFTEEGTLLSSDSDDLLELRMFLDDPALLKQVAQYALRRERFELLMCWADILEFMSIPEASGDYQVGKALHIYRRYIAMKAPVVLQGVVVEKEFREKIQREIETANGQRDSAVSKGLPKQLFCPLQHQCFVALFNSIFMAFKTTMGYQGCRQHIRQEANVVTVDDFQYMELLGYGAFGFVVHCVKRSTGKHFAMKVQTKKGLVQMFSGAAERVTLEKDVVATCHHPFIVSMDYALQTSTLVMMVMDLGSAGTLHDALECCDRGEMSVERVRFYSAEIFLALSHIHRLGLIYRDLKPSNVLLNEDGHIQLVDLGGIVDVGGEVVGYHGVEETMGGMFAQDYDHRERRHSDYSHSISRDESRHQNSMSSSANSKAVQHAMAGPGPDTSIRNNSSRSVSAGLAACTVNVIPSNSRSGNKNGKGDPESGHVHSAKSSGGKYGTYKMAELKRATSIMGTNGYMAPEMLALICHQSNHPFSSTKSGYTCAVDYWSLGCVMFKLLTGCNAFKNEDVVKFSSAAYDKLCCVHPEVGDTFVDVENGSATETALVKTKYKAPPGGSGDLESMMVIESSITGPQANCKHISSQPYMKQLYIRLDGVAKELPIECYEIITKLLVIDENDRLGSGSKGVKAVKGHSFFKGVRWSAMGQKQVEPPFLPKARVHAAPSSISPYESFEEMMSELDLTSWMRGHLSNFEQQMFETWDFVSPGAIKLEISAEEEFVLSNLLFNGDEGDDRTFFGGDSVIAKVASFVRLQSSNDASIRVDGSSSVRVVKGTEVGVDPAHQNVGMGAEVFTGPHSSSGGVLTSPLKPPRKGNVLSGATSEKYAAARNGSLSPSSSHIVEILQEIQQLNGENN